eukprot:SAG11_NODE_429_length_9534_cov_14.689242_11_plen_121_part_00
MAAISALSTESTFRDTAISVLALLDIFFPLMYLRSLTNNDDFLEQIWLPKAEKKARNEAHKRLDAAANKQLNKRLNKLLRPCTPETAQQARWTLPVDIEQPYIKAVHVDTPLKKLDGGSW